jgi:F-type H+-transporting ATPase subunit delta
MNDSKISVRYAKAYFEAAVEDKIIEKVIKDIKLFQASLGLKGFTEFLESPVIKVSEKRKVVAAVFEKNVERLSFDFLNLIITNKRENYLPHIIRNFIDLYKKNQGIKHATLSIPFDIPDDYHKKFIALLEEAFKVKIELEEVIDPDLIGGFILKVEDQQFDASVRTELNKIKKRLLETAIVNN